MWNEARSNRLDWKWDSKENSSNIVRAGQWKLRAVNECGGPDAFKKRLGGDSDGLQEQDNGLLRTEGEVEGEHEERDKREIEAGEGVHIHNGAPLEALFTLDDVDSDADTGGEDKYTEEDQPRHATQLG